MNEDHLIITTHHGVGIIKLNRPRALNALSIDMILGIQSTLKQWQDDPAILFVYLTSTTEKAFCAGGDVKSLYEHVMQGDMDYPRYYLKEQYAMDLMIHEYPKPVMSYLHGYVLGGGAGLAMATSIRVTSDDVYFGMPEVHIGFFPDVGASYFLPRFLSHVGTYLAVTGKLINSDDLLYLNISHFKIAKDQFLSVEEQILTTKWEKETFKDKLHDLLALHHHPSIQGSVVKKIEPFIQTYYQVSSLRDLYSLLMKNGSHDAIEHMKYLDTLCHASIQITFELFKRAQFKSLRDCFKLEYDLAQGIVQTSFFKEGVKKVLIEKTGNPKWGPHDKEEIAKVVMDQLFIDHTVNGIHPLS